MVERPDPPGPVLLEIGRIERPHGLDGEVVVSLVTDRVGRLEPGSVLYTDRGPLTVGSSRRHTKRHLVRFDRITDRTDAEAWRGVILSAEPIDDPEDDTLWAHELVGARVIDQHGVDHGTVVSVLDNPASDLLELEDGQLVPLTFLVGLVPGRRVDVDVPAGLLESRPSDDQARN